MDEAQRQSAERRNRCAFVVLGVFAGLAISVLAHSLFFDTGVSVIVFNADSKALDDVVVHVTGNSYPVGNIGPGHWRRISVQSKGESGVAVEFRERDGSRRRLDAGGYFESGYSGTIAVTLTQEKVVSSICDARPWP